MCTQVGGGTLYLWSNVSSNNLGAAQVMAGMVSAIGAFKENIIPQHCDDKNNDEGYENEDKDAQEDNGECLN